jgi:hypothetical protein
VQKIETMENNAQSREGEVYVEHITKVLIKIGDSYPFKIKTYKEINNYVNE